MSASSTCCPSIGATGAGLHERLALHMGADLQQVLGRKNTQGINQWGVELPAPTTRCNAHPHVQRQNVC